MENATKALLIAGTVLIAIIMVSIAIYLYTLFSNQSEIYTETMSAVELEKFNSQFDVYVGRTNITAQEIASLGCLAKEYNYQVRIFVGGMEIKFYRKATTTPESFIKYYQNKTFSCKLSTSNYTRNPVYDENGKIMILRFTVNA